MKKSILPFLILAAMLGAAALGCGPKKETSGKETPSSSGAKGETGAASDTGAPTTGAPSEWSYAGAPTPALEGDPVSRLRTIAFGEGSHELSAEGMTACSEAAAKLMELPHVRVGVIGFADGVGEKEGAQELGLQRAESVRAQLASLGIPAVWVQVASYGDRASTGDAGKAEMERRAEVWILQ